MINSIVLIKSKQNNSFGTGFSIYSDREGVYILTCAHVIEDVVEPIIENIEAKTIHIGSKDGLDLALLYVKNLKKTPLKLSTDICNRFEVSGYRKHFQHQRLKTLEGEVDSKPSYDTNEYKTPIKVWELKIDEAEEDHIQQGYSGSPIICKRTKRVIAVASERFTGVRRAICIDISHLKELWQEIPKELLQTQNYDIFISYRIIHKEWVEILAKNLKNSGYKIFLDDWEIRAGEDYWQKIITAVQNSKAGILIATPDSTDSGWVQKEYKLMQKERAKREFNFIPITFGKFEHIPFLKTTHAILFEDNYKKSFYKIICSLKKESADSFESFTQELIYPKEKTKIKRIYRKRFIEEVFEKLEHKPLMILSREHFNTSSYIDSLKLRAIELYGRENILSIYSPSSLTSESQEYFSTIAMQCGLEGVNSSASFNSAFSQKFQEGKKLFLLISGFENGDNKIRRAFAQNLRQMYIQNSKYFDLVIFGGYKLIKLKYRDGGLSPLEFLEEYLIPEPTLQDWQEIFGKDIDSQKLTKIEELTGKDPKLTHFCIQNSCEELRNSDLIFSSIFSHFYSNAKEICELLKKDSFGKFKTWSLNTLYRKLFWHNLTIKSKKKFSWRSEFIREMFVEELECE